MVSKDVVALDHVSQFNVPFKVHSCVKDEEAKFMVVLVNLPLEFGG